MYRISSGLNPGVGTLKTGGRGGRVSRMHCIIRNLWIRIRFHLVALVCLPAKLYSIGTLLLVGIVGIVELDAVLWIRFRIQDLC